jgi:eukaryotic-like serine/threonine-protein kinase
MVEPPKSDAPTLADGATLVPAGTAAAAVILPPPGYALGAQIGRGGMGEVLAATDLRIGREVCVKRMISEKPDTEQVTRFLREARIQARLEHPAIVPVHELGVDELGRPFFTMKRLAGKTLGEKQADGTGLNPMLRAFADVCLAIEFAHSRGVVHRDLKPSNIMLGDYGEVYVIDWGIARVIADDREAESPQQGDISTLDDGSTKSGALLGTPGFMSPEQIRGGRATPAADIYALGAILFEILAGVSLHKRGQPGIATTLSTPQVAPSSRKPDRNIPPELDAACFDALAELPEQRPTARMLADKVQAYLDGDRDIERRRLLASAQVRAAAEVLATEAPDARASAMRRAGRAIALDPENEEAATIVGALLLDPPPPDKMPPDLANRLDDDERAANKKRSSKAMLAYLSIFGVLPLVLVVEVKNWQLLIGFYGLVLVAALSAVQAARTGRPVASVVLLINLGLAILFTRLAGPFVLTPLMICCALVGITPIPWVNQRAWVVISWTLGAVLLPIVLEWIGFLPKTWEIGEGVMHVVSNLVRTHGRLDEVGLVFGNLLFTMVVALMLLTINRERRASQRQLFVQAWHLRQLLPSVKRAWATRPHL